MYISYPLVTLAEAGMVPDVLLRRKEDFMLLPDTAVSAQSELSDMVLQGTGYPWNL